MTKTFSREMHHPPLLTPDAEHSRTLTETAMHLRRQRQGDGKVKVIGYTASSRGPRIHETLSPKVTKKIKRSKGLDGGDGKRKNYK